MAFDFSKLSVLIVEDTAPMKKLIASILDALGVGEILTSDNGEDGYMMFRQNRPDIILADWEMRPMNGIDLTKKIRNDHNSPNRFIPIILVTGYSSLNRVTEARNVGVTEFLVKPFSANDLSKRLAYVINKPRDFIDHDEFFGPDRRRRVDPTYEGPERRSS